MVVGGQSYALVALPLVKTRYPLRRRLDGPQGRSGRVRKISSRTGIRSPDRPASSESLYRLNYLGNQHMHLRVGTYHVLFFYDLYVIKFICWLAQLSRHNREAMARTWAEAL
jgi:hypothetical protein